MGGEGRLCRPETEPRGFRPGEIILGNIAIAIDISEDFLLSAQMYAMAKGRFVTANE